MNTPDEAREQAVKLAQRSVASGQPMAWFEELYKSANGNTSVIPWSDGIPNPYMVPWFEKTGTRGEGKTAVVVGCGLGEDAEEISRRGYDVTAFDLSPSAIEWCKKLYRDSKVTYHAANLFELPKEIDREYDFIYECYTIQALPRSMRKKTMEAIASLLAKGGQMLLVSRVWHNEPIDDGPPWPLTEEELSYFNELGLDQESSEHFWDEENGYKRVRKIYRRYR